MRSVWVGLALAVAVVFGATGLYMDAAVLAGRWAEKQVASQVPSALGQVTVSVPDAESAPSVLRGRFGSVDISGDLANSGGTFSMKLTEVEKSGDTLQFSSGTGQFRPQLPSGMKVRDGIVVLSINDVAEIQLAPALEGDRVAFSVQGAVVEGEVFDKAAADKLIDGEPLGSIALGSFLPAGFTATSVVIQNGSLVVNAESGAGSLGQ